ncbi:MAG: Radical domain protein [Firmicutes bacterium]|nr:Radical domain protein [Bacillota bacterium]
MKNTAKVKTIMLSISDKCNLDCVYCYQINKSGKTMSCEIAKDTITKHLMNAKDFDEVYIDLTGGEIFLEFDFIKEICNWAWNRTWPKPFLFFATSNGTLVHGKIQEWLTNNRKKFWVGLSIDGTREMHNKNRSNSYDLIDFDFFKKNWPTQGIKMTISPWTLSELSKGIIELQEKGFIVNASFAQLSNWSDPEYKNILKKELKVLADYYIEHSQVPMSSILDISLHSIIKRNNKPIKWCGTGTHMVSIDTEGNEYPCHFFMPNTMNNSSYWRVTNFSNPDDLIDSSCKSCKLFSMCPTCYGANIVQNGHPAIRDKFLCEFTKIRAAAISYIIGKKLIKGVIKLENQKLINDTIFSINEIQKEII